IAFLNLLGKAEVHHLNLRAKRQHYILRLNVPMNDSVGMRFGQCVSHLDRYVQRFLQAKRFSCNSVRESLPLHVLHDDKTLGIPFTYFMNCTNIWVIKFGSGVSLPQKSLFGDFVSIGWFQELDRDLAIKVCVLGKI